MVSSSFLLRHRNRRRSGFTLVELLIVILIILLLAALTLAAGEAAMNSAARSRAKGELQAISSSLENYKTDNGTYPWVTPASTLPANGQTSFSSTADYSHSPSLAGDYYYVGAQVLYESLSGKTNFTDAPVAGVKSYMDFKTSQLGNVKATANNYSATGSTYVQDPFSYPYGYFTGTTAGSLPYNGSGLFDLWSTGGTTTSTPNWPTISTWIANWQL